MGIQAALPLRSAAVPSRPAPHAVSTSSAAVALVDLEQRGRRLQVAHAQAAAAQHRRGRGAPLVEQQLDAAHDLEGGAGRGAVDQVGGALGGGQGRDGVDRLARRPAAAQLHADLAGQHDQAAAARGQQAPREQLLGRGGGLLDRAPWCGPSRSVASPPAASTCSSSARAVPDRAASRAVMSATEGGSAEKERSPLTPASSPPTSASATPVRARTPSGHLPHQGQVLEVVQRRVDTVAGSPLTSATSSLDSGLADDDQGIKDSELESRELVERTRRPRTAWPLARPGGPSREGRAWRDRCGTRAVARAARRARRAAGRPATGIPRRATTRTSGPRYRGRRGARDARWLPVRQVELHHGAATDVGLVREQNEDSFLVEPPVYVVADGMGGHDGGEVASRIVVEEFGRLATPATTPSSVPRPCARPSTAASSRSGSTTPQQRRAGALQFHSATTAVVAMLIEDDGLPAWLVANVGDSRAYRFNDGVLTQVSVDHSRVQELWEAGQDHRRPRWPPTPSATW